MATAAERCLEAVRVAVRRFSMFAPEDTVLAAVSGGPDSMCLLHALSELGYKVEAAHLDHQTRGKESAGDAAFVQETATRLGVPVYIERRPVSAEAENSDLSFEEYARRVRYEFLVRKAKERACRAVATGHHADDQAETVLMRVVRGTTPSGLAGIPPVRKIEGVRVVRPLMKCTRTMILEYLEERGLKYRVDSSNQDPVFQRNKVRLELLPHLARDYNPRVAEALLRLSDVQRDENDLLDRIAREFLEKCLRADGAVVRKLFADGHPALQRRALLLLAWRRGVDCPFERVEAGRKLIADGAAGAGCDLGQGLSLRNARDVTEVLTATPEPQDRIVPLIVPGESKAFAKRFLIRYLRKLPDTPLAEYCTPTRQVFDGDAVGANLSVRHRRPGDRFTPFGMSGTKKLKDYYIDLGLPHSQRASQLLLVSGERIAWVIGHAISADAAVTEHTIRPLEVEVLDAPQ
ncbi:MAG: tRNA lysidine(34) synthetase TilS [Candidatus Hydrogenedentes bacterium]|nr:tRNA lysidine(34) synthetase TilS [Candidatus Hydrogenedentota bacterium]